MFCVYVLYIWIGAGGLRTLWLFCSFVCVLFGFCFACLLPVWMLRGVCGPFGGCWVGAGGLSALWRLYICMCFVCLFACFRSVGSVRGACVPHGRCTYTCVWSACCAPLGRGLFGCGEGPSGPFAVVGSVRGACVPHGCCTYSCVLLGCCAPLGCGSAA